MDRQREEWLWFIVLAVFLVAYVCVMCIPDWETDTDTSTVVSANVESIPIVETKTEYIYNTIYDTIYIEYSIDIPYSIYECTGYNLDDPSQGTNSTVSIGLDLDGYNFPVIAVDPEVIPYYSIVEIRSLDGDLQGFYVAMDTGGAIREKRIDILFPTKTKAIDFGRKEMLVRVLK